MASLVKCFECGRELSSDAKFCPNCGTGAPHGYICAVCCQIGRISDIKKHSKIHVYYTSDDGDRQTWEEIKSIMHPICFDKVQQEFKNSVQALQSYCPICKAIISYKPLEYIKNMKIHGLPTHCSKCGHPKLKRLYSPDDSAIECSHCKMPLLKGAAVYTMGGGLSHEVCAENRTYLLFKKWLNRVFEFLS
jgi:hypothetical protein